MRPLFTTILVSAIVLSIACGAFAQSADMEGWESLRWGATKGATLKALQRFRAHECDRADASCAAAGVVIDNYSFSGVPFRVLMTFGPKDSLASVTMTAEEKRDSVEKVLAQLTSRYGRGGLQSEYDGDEETLRTKWNWNKPHGTCVLESDEGSGVFIVTFTAKASDGLNRSGPTQPRHSAK